MIILLSPAKSLNFDKQMYALEPSQALLRKRSKDLIEHMQNYSVEDLKKLMHISDDLANLNFNRFQQFKKVHNLKNSKPAIYAFNGDVYRGLNSRSFTKKELGYTQDRLRMLSGLYGILKPMDLIQAYRLEMGTKTKINGHKNLYEFWGMDITKDINKSLKSTKSEYLLNLASVEYFKSVKKDKVKGSIIDIHFREYKGSDLKFVSFTAKVARGMMAHYAIKNKINTLDSLKAFDYEGYKFEKSLSSEKELYFIR